MNSNKRHRASSLLVVLLALGALTAFPGAAPAAPAGLFATQPKIDKVRLSCAYTGPWKGRVRVDADVRYSDVLKEARYRGHYLAVRGTVALARADGSRLAMVRDRGRLRVGVKGIVIRHHHHAYLSRKASKRVLRYARHSPRCARKEPGKARTVSAKAKIFGRLTRASARSSAAAPPASGQGSAKTQSFAATGERRIFSANPPLFGPPIGTASGGESPFDLAVGSFTKVPIPDLVVANNESKSVSVLLGTGTGGFAQAPGSPIAVGGAPLGVAVGDLNGDGVEDFAAAVDRGSVAVMLGNGNGAFTPAKGSPFPTGNYSTHVAMGDFNGDGKTDLAVSNQAANNVSILLGTGTGSFTTAPGSPVAVGSMPPALAVGRFTSFQKDDLAVANNRSNNVSILLGTGTGIFASGPGSPVAVGSNPTSLAVGDLNGDNRDDIAVTNQVSNNVTILLGTGVGTFTPAPISPIPVGQNPLSLAIGDLNGDKHADLAIASYGPSSITVLLGTGTGEFVAAPGSPFAAGSGPFAVAIGDINGDGKNDLTAADNRSNKVSVLLNNG